MKSVLIALVAAATLAACGKKEEAPAPAAVVVTPKQDAQPVSATAASEPAKTEEAKK